MEEFKGQVNLSFSIRNPERFKELYENSTGILTASSSIPGQVSKCSPQLGSYFTSSFVEVHKELTSISNNSNWEDLIRKVTDRTERLAEINNFTQTPQFEIRVTGVNRASIGWDGLISGNNNVFNERPNNFQCNNPYVQSQYVVARIVMFSNNRVFFLMSDNYIVEYFPYSGLVFRGYRGSTAFPNQFCWAIFNPDSPNTFLVWEVDRRGLIWMGNSFVGYQNVGIVYY